MTDTLRRIQHGPSSPERLLVILPGYGDRPEPFLDRAERYDPDGRWLVTVVEPMHTGRLGPIWYEVDENGPDPVAIAAAIDAVSGICSQLLTTTGLDASSLVLCGFSQGGALALATMLDPSAITPGAIAALATYLPARDEMDLGIASGRPILFAHGSDDETVEIIRGRSAAKALHRADALVSWHEVEGGHRFDGELVETLRIWLDAISRGDAPHTPPI